MLNALTKHLFLQEQNLNEQKLIAKLAQAYETDAEYLDISKSNFTQLDFGLLNFDDSDVLLNVVVLNISYNTTTITNVVIPASLFPNLKYLYLYQSKIQNISIIGNLPHLVEINAAQNELREFSLPNAEFESLERINLDRNNQLTSPSPEIVKQGGEAVAVFLKSQKGGTRPLNEAKIILVGEGGVGKTSIVKQFLNKGFDKKEPLTHGIQIQHEIYKINNTDVKLRYWDFGGQEILHAIHQFFLTKRSVYVLVLDSRKEGKVEYWLKHIQNFGDSAPTLVVINKIDDHSSFDLNKTNLKENYPFIKGFFRVSCATKKGITELQNAVFQEIWDLELRKSEWLVKWLEVKKEFESMEVDYISRQAYKKKCSANNIEEEEEQETLLKYLHDLGIVFYFENLRQYNTLVLNPLWLVNALYRILYSPKIANAGGKFNSNHLKEIIFDKHYDTLLPNLPVDPNQKNYNYSGKYLFIADIMQEFELSFQIAPNQYIIPELLPVEQNAYKFNVSDKLIRFIIEYPDFMPNSILPRLMVRLHKKIKKNMRWQTGMVLESKEPFKAIANVIADIDKKSIYLTIGGQEPRLMLRYILDELSKVNEKFSKLRVIERLPLSDSFTGESVESKHLMRLKSRDKTIYPGKTKDYRIDDLLNGIESNDLLNGKENDKIRMYISYHKKDKEYLEKLKTCLKPIERNGKIALWDKSQLLPGDDIIVRPQRELKNADIIFFLMSHDALADDSFIEEVEMAKKRYEDMQKEDQHKVIIVPIILRECLWETDTFLSRFNPLPANGIPITDNSNHDKAWNEITKGIIKLLPSNPINHDKH